MIVYVAGPYTHPDPVINTRNAILAGEELMKKGATLIIPDLCDLWHLSSLLEENFWYNYSLKLLFLCDALLRLGGESKGADKEVRIAEEELFLDIYYSLEEVPDAY